MMLKGYHLLTKIVPISYPVNVLPQEKGFLVVKGV